MSTYPPAPTTSDLVKIRPVQGGVPSPITRYVPLGDLPGGGAGVSTVTDGVHTVTNASTIDFTAGATVTNLGGGVAGVSISGGGTTSTSLTLYDTHGNTLTNVGTVAVAGSGTVGGSGTIGTISGFGGGGGGYVFADGLGISNDTITNPGTVTINNTGTIVLPAASSNTGSGAGILLSPGAPGTLSGNVGSINIYGPKINQPGTASPVYGGATYLFGSNVNITDTAGSGGGGYVQGGGGGAAILNGVTQAIGAQFRMNGGYILGGSTATGGSGSFYAGAALDAATNIGGNFSITAGAGSTQGGNLTLGAGTGAMNGVLLVNNLPTADPHQLGALWVLDTLTGAAAISQG